MAVGSNSLGLFFKIGADPSAYLAALQQMMAENAEFRKGVEEGVQAEVKAFAGIGTAVKGTEADFNKALTQVNEFRRGVQDIASGNIFAAISQLGRSMGGVGLAIAAALAALAFQAAIAKKAFDALLDTAKEVGTTSKDDFDALRKSIERVGGALTDADHTIAANLTQSVKDLHSVFDSLMVDVLRQIGKPLIVLIQNVGKEILLLKGPIEFIGWLVGNTLAGIAIEFEILRLTREKGLKGLLPSEFYASIVEARRLVREALTAPLPVVPFDPGKQVKDASDAAERENKARIDLLEANSKREQQIYERTALSAKLGYMGGALISAEATAIEIQAREKLRKVLEDNATEISGLSKKQDETDTERAAREQRLDNDKIEQEKQLIAEGQKFQEALNQADATQRKNDEDRLKRLDTILKGEKELDEIVKGRARAAQGVPGGGAGTPGRDLPPIPGIGSVSDAIKNLPSPDLSIWQEWSKGVAGAFGQVADSFGGVQGILSGGLQKIASALEDSIAGWILYGKLSGKALKQAAADAIAGMVAQAIVATIFELAAAAASYAWGDIPGAIKHLHAAEIYGTVAAIGAVVGAAIGAGGGLVGAGGGATATAGGGGGFGGSSSEPPGTVTINQGSPGTLGVSLLSSIDNHLSNITTAPPGDILQRGADQNPMAVGQANNEAARRDGTVSREFLQISGLRTA